MQGDVIGLLDAAGSMGSPAFSYAYDAWGNLISVKGASGNTITDPHHVANINPIRYRGYYHDAESGLYYLQSRYYDPEVGRFINMDSLLGSNTGSATYNLFAYCGNNPVNMSDPSGFGIGEWFADKWTAIKIWIADFRRDYDQPDPQTTIGPLGSVKGDIGTGWSFRIDSSNDSTLTQRHIHLMNGAQEYSQNEDGTPHDGSKGDPPNSVKKYLKKKGIWDCEAHPKV